MNIYLVRHGETLHNAIKGLNLKDPELTDIGIEQAQEAKEKLKDIHFDAVYCSPLKRTRQTAEIISASPHIIYDERLCERGALYPNYKSTDVIDRKEYWNYFSKIQYGESENIKIFFKRVYSFLDDLTENAFNNVLLVTHKGVSKAINGYFEGIKDGYFYDKGLNNCEVKVYTTERAKSQNYCIEIN